MLKGTFEIDDKAWLDWLSNNQCYLSLPSKIHSLLQTWSFMNFDVNSLLSQTGTIRCIQPLMVEYDDSVSLSTKCDHTTFRFSVIAIADGHVNHASTHSVHILQLNFGIV